MPNESSQSNKQLLTVAEVAERLKLSVSLIYAMVNAGTLPSLRVGNGRGSIRFREGDVQEYLDGCAVTKKHLGHDLSRYQRQSDYKIKHLVVRKGTQS